MGSLIDRLKQECVQDLNRVRARADAVRLLERTMEQLVRRGFAPDLGQDKGGFVRLRVDLDAIEGRRLMIAAPEAGPPVDGEMADPAPPEVGDVSESPADDATAAPTPPPEAPAPRPVRRASAELVTGPVSDAERAQIVELSAAGREPREIAKRLNRPVGTVNVMRRHLKARIDAAVVSKAADVLTGGGDPVSPPVERKPEPATPAAAPRPPAPVAPVAPVTADKSASVREIEVHLDWVGYEGGWTPQTDFALARSLARGDGAAGAAERLNRPKPEVIHRWKVLNTDPHSIDHQVRLVKVLRQRAGEAIAEG